MANKIIEWIKNNKGLALIIAGIIIFLILIISALIPERDNRDLALIEQPLYFYENRRLILKESAFDDVEYPNKGLEVYRIKDLNQNIKVESIITLLNIQSPKKVVTANNMVYEWKNNDGDTVWYDTQSQDVTITLENRKDVFPNVVSPSESDTKALLQTFVKKYINNSYEYYDINVRKEGLDTVIEGRRKIGDYPLQKPGLYKYYDYLKVDENFKLKSARILIAEFEEKAVEKLKLLKPEELNSVISNRTYPKEINQGFPQGVDIVTNNKEYFQGDNLGIEIPKVTLSNLDNLEIVYLFSLTSQQFLTPVYRMDGEGKIILQGNELTLDIVANVSAIDPDYVYIPSNIIYTQ